MFYYYLRTALRNLRSNKRFTLINITGFAFAISVCLAIALFLAREYSFDRFNSHSDETVRVVDMKTNSSMIDYRVKDILTSNFPEIENACLVLRSGHPYEIKCLNKGYYLDDILSVDNNFFQVFTIQFVSAPASSPFTDINSAVITESTARLLFGDESALGKELLVWGNITVKITAVIKDFPANSSITASLLVNAENENFKFYRSIGNSEDLSTYRWLFQIYLQLKPGVDHEQLLSKINANSDLLHPYQEEAGFLKLKDVYLHDSTSGSETIQGNQGLLNLLTGIALIILILAIINYVNLTIAQQNQRNKDTGIKKTFGASRFNVLFYYLIESVIVSLIALILGLYLVWIMLPFYNIMFDATLRLSTVLRFPNSMYLFISILAVGLISGTGPALIFSAINPVKVLNGIFTASGKKHHLRNFLTVFQFAISIILIFCVVVVRRQINFVKNQDPGFGEEQLLRVDIPNIQEADARKSIVMVDEFRKSPYVKSVSLTSGVPGEIRMSMGSNMENKSKNMSVPCLMADTAFLPTFDLKIVMGRDLEPGDYGTVCMMNEAAYRHFEFDNLENKRFNNFGGFDIIAIVNDFQYTSLHKTIGPVCIMFTSKSRPTSINIRFVRNGTGPGMDLVTGLWDEMLPGYPLKYQFYDEWFDSLYKSEERLAKMISLFATLAIVISCIGILGLAIFSSERRTKEIGIRKVNGAKVLQVIILINKEFITWVCFAFLIGIPVMYLSMHKWLETFAYRTTLSWWIFAFSGALALLIASLTVTWQTWRAATRNPVEALRYE